MTLAKKSLAALGGVPLLVVAIGVFLPATAGVERAITIEAPRATVFALLNDWHQFSKWRSPWPDSDPNTRVDIEGPRRGVGATVRWTGTVAGEGSRSITESVPFERVVSETTLNGADAGVTTFTLHEAEPGTTVELRFERDFGLNVFGRYYGRMLDGILGEGYAAGLEQLKIMAESLPPSDFSDLGIEHVIVESMDIVFMPTSSEPLARAISEALGDAYFHVLSFIDEHGLREAGAPISISRAFSGAEIRFDAGVPVRGITASTPRSKDLVQIGRSYGGPVIRVEHRGSYLTLGRTHDKIAAYLAALGIERDGDAWESYVSDPTRTATEELLTYVYYPIRPDG